MATATTREKQKIRELYKHYKKLSPSQKKQLIERMKKYKSLPLIEQKKLKNKWNNLTPQQKMKFKRRINKSHHKRKRGH